MGGVALSADRAPVLSPLSLQAPPAFALPSPTPLLLPVGPGLSRSIPCLSSNVSRYLDKTYIKLFYLQNRITITISTLIPVNHHKIQNASDTVNKLSTYNTPV